MSISLRAANNGAALALGLAYPFLAYAALRAFSSGLLVLVFAVFLVLRLGLAALGKSRTIGTAERWLIALAGGGALLWALISPVAGLKAYPIFVSGGFAIVFGHSLLFPPTIIERFARLRPIEVTPGAQVYFRRVTHAWIVFFIANGSISALTALNGDLELWTLYNGFISYLLIGAMFAGEWLARRRLRARIDQTA
ncbi:MAG TPA: hypothetical protein VHX19_16145 [Stellaceae bacterium]|nr:hypothetical protein [Stellaceae bacterium]